MLPTLKPNLIDIVLWLQAQTLPNPGGEWSQPTEWIQRAYDFVRGPYAIAISVMLFIAIIVGWGLFPKEGFLGQALRIFAILIAIGNSVFFVTSLRFNG